ncbi:MAG TPA: trypsin-like peptidase domain-containing protein [Thermoanaerobaculia bacterium]|nr:trypsin-like peptidase domain-containing protein [Thermoanaerobaculia bacterium]
MVRRALGWFVLVFVSQLGLAVEIDSVLVPEGIDKEAAEPALRLAEKASVQPLARLREASVGARDQLDAIAAWNRAGNVPARNGFSRPLALAKSVRFTADLLLAQPSRHAGGALLAPPSGGLVWAAEVKVENAHRLRLHLTDVDLPPDTRMWVYGDEGGEEVSFEAGLVTSGREIWTPSVGGSAIRLEVRLPEKDLGGRGFTVDRVLETFELDSEGAPVLGFSGNKVDFSCALDAACQGAAALATIETYKRAVAHLQFVRDGDGFVCTGALMNDTDDSTFVPYLLTANHCFNSQASASSLESFFDYIAQGCLGARPGLSSLPRTVGATLLASGATTDFSFVRLSSLPAGRGLLGSTSEAVASGTVLSRLSHPFGISQGFSTATLAPSGPTCVGTPRPNFLYSVRAQGAVFPGSSGAPVVRPDGRVVGQLLGACGPTASTGEGCDSGNYTVDGALSVTWPSIAQWLAPAAGSPGCTPGATTLCLANGRFKVEATYDTGAAQGQAQTVKLTDETGYLWFFNESNVETVVKVLNGCGLNSRFWVFAGGLTNVQVRLTVTDTAKGTSKTYTNPPGTPFQPIQDTDALATCP